MLAQEQNYSVLIAGNKISFKNPWTKNPIEFSKINMKLYSFSWDKLNEKIWECIEQGFNPTHVQSFIDVDDENEALYRLFQNHKHEIQHLFYNERDTGSKDWVRYVTKLMNSKGYEVVFIDGSGSGESYQKACEIEVQLTPAEFVDKDFLLMSAHYLGVNIYQSSKCREQIRGRLNNYIQREDKFNGEKQYHSAYTEELYEEVILPLSRKYDFKQR